MFENFLNDGSVLGVLCLVYASNVAIEVSSRARGSQKIGSAVGQNLLGTLLVFCAIPCILWPAIYVGGFDGWLAGLLSWIIFQLLGAIFSLTLRIRGVLLGLHVLTGIVSLGVGYYLTLSNLPWKSSELLAHELELTHAHQVGFLNCQDAIDIHLGHKDVSLEVRFHVDQYFKTYTRHSSYSLVRAERQCAKSGQSISIHTAMVSL